LDELLLLNGNCIDDNIIGANYVRNITIDNLMISALPPAQNTLALQP